MSQYCCNGLCAISYSDSRYRQIIAGISLNIFQPHYFETCKLLYNGDQVSEWFRKSKQRKKVEREAYDNRLYLVGKALNVNKTLDY